MAFDLAKIKQELASRPLYSPVPLELAIAIVNDLFRMANVVKVADSAWKQWPRTASKLWPEQMGMLAHILSTTSLREETVAVLPATAGEGAARLHAFFDAIEPLTAEMIRANVFRQEELLRHWVAAWSGEVAGEGPDESARRLEQLDYRRALKELQRADAARKKEAAARAKALRDAQEREAAARGWRE